jgi:hypothetical protein
METVRFCDTLTSTESVERSAYLQGALLVVSTGCHAGQLYTSALPAVEVPMRGRGPLGCYSPQDTIIRWTFHMKTAEGLVTGLQRWARGVLSQPLPAQRLLFSFGVLRTRGMSHTTREALSSL